MYREVTNPVTKEIMNCILRTEDSAVIPFDPDNMDYQQYLQWVSQGNKPLPPVAEGTV